MTDHVLIALDIFHKDDDGLIQTDDIIAALQEVINTLEKNKETDPGEGYDMLVSAGFNIGGDNQKVARVLIGDVGALGAIEQHIQALNTAGPIMNFQGNLSDIIRQMTSKDDDDGEPEDNILGNIDVRKFFDDDEEDDPDDD